jgi:TPR repeat protein
MESSRPPTSASKTSGRSTASRQSERSNHSTEATSYDNSVHDQSRALAIGAGPYAIGNGPYDQRPGPPSRSMTMPNQAGFPTDQRRPSEASQSSGRSNYGPPPNIHNNSDARSGSSAGFRNNEPRPGFGPASRAQTFDVRPNGPGGGTAHAKKESLDDYMPNFDSPGANQPADEYMPNFDGPGTTQPLEDAIGLPLDGAPGIARPPTSLSQVHASKSQPNLREQFDELGFGPPQNAPPLPLPHAPNAFQNGQRRVDSPESFMGAANSRGFGGPQRGGYGGGPGRGQPDFYQGGPHQGDPRDNWGDPRNNQLRSAPPGGPPGGGFRGLPQNRTSNPDGLPGHPVPVRPGLAQNQNGRPGGPPQNHRRQPSGQRNSGASGAPPRPVTPPVTHEELEQLRKKLQTAPSDYKSHLRLAKRLVEASNILIDTQGDLDLKTRNRNREKFVLEAHRVIKKLVQHSYPDAMFYLAECYGAGNLGLQVDHKEAFSLYQSAAKMGHPGAAYRTAVCCEIGGEGSRKDPQKAVQWYRRAATLGDVGAMYKLGVILLRGLLGQQASTGEGVIWLNRAAERADEANPHAVHELGMLHEFPPRGGKLIQDTKYALQLYQQAAKLGYRLSQTRLGKAFEHGQLDCPFDDRASIHWYSKAAAQEEPEAELALSGWYLTGARGVLEPNDQESYLWARKAALREYPKAEYAMGHFSEVGIGCQVNLEDAKRWYGRSACKFTVYLVTKSAVC